MAAGVTAPTYTREILRLAVSLEPPHELARCDCAAELRSPTCGSTIAIGVMLDEAGRIADLSQRVSACAFGQASAALLAASARGCSRCDIERGLAGLEDWLGGGADPDWPGASALEPARAKAGRHGAILLPFRALVAAMREP